jgi:hypothetical protein
MALQRVHSIAVLLFMIGQALMLTVSKELNETEAFDVLEKFSNFTSEIDDLFDAVSLLFPAAAFFARVAIFNRPLDAENEMRMLSAFALLKSETTPTIAKFANFEYTTLLPINNYPFIKDMLKIEYDASELFRQILANRNNVSISQRYVRRLNVSDGPNLAVYGLIEGQIYWF